MDTSRVYVYGIVHADRPLPPGTCGVGRPSAPVRLLEVGALAAVVSEVPDDLRARRRDLMAHQQLLLDLGADAPVLPMRFGMVAEDEATVQHAVDVAASAHLAALDRLEGRQEMNVKAMPAQDSVEPLVRNDAGLRRMLADVRGHPTYEGNVALGRAVAEGLTRRAADTAAEALPEFTSLAEEVVRGPDVEGCVLNASFLVAKARCDRFRSAVEVFAARHRTQVELRLTGPLPCYSFVAYEPLGAQPAHATAAGR